MELFVSSLEKVAQSVYQYEATHVISLLLSNDFKEVVLPPMFDKNNWLRLNMDDVIDADVAYAPQLQQIIHILDWANRLPDDAKVLIHCQAGISRSTAVALMLKVKILGVDRIDDAIAWLKDHRPMACPNPVIITYADQLLGAGGELYEKSESFAFTKLLGLYGNSPEIVKNLRNNIKK